MNLHGQIMNLPAPTDAKITEVVRGGNEIYAYKVGHRDARLAAAELAQKADARIAELEFRVMEFESANSGDPLLSALYWREIAENGWPFEWEVASRLQEEVKSLRAALLATDNNARSLEAERAAMQAGIRMEAERREENREALAEAMGSPWESGSEMLLVAAAQHIVELEQWLEAARNSESAALERVAKAEAERDKAKATMQESIALMRDVY